MIYFILLLHSVIVAISATREREPKIFDYECGAHGRFEYCIEGLPGCVVGCHCYPGYYFDTESKICEHNTKLTQDFRRALPPISYNLPPSQLQPPPSANVGDKRDDDLSDWLYNQFFKTVESQVINKTDGDELMLKTRRSGGPLESMTRRRSRKKKRKKTKKRLRKKDGDSDDESDDDSSDSDYDSDSSDSSTSSESDSSGDLGSWERHEFGKPKPDQPGGEEEGGGARREIVVYSKKPKPPLPSFIFLPNMNSPYFPPIGLPAPAMPAMPMYPMVPIPPMISDCNNTSVTPTTSEQTTTKITTTTKKKGRRKWEDNGRPFDLPNQKPPLLNSVVTPDPLQDDYLINDDYQNLNPERTYMPKTHLQSFERDNNIGIEDGKPNFNYISQLIHRESNKVTTQVPLNRTSVRRQFHNPKTPIPYDKKKRTQIKPGFLNDKRRRFDTRINGQDDSYYSTLGRQIAQLIRGIEAKDETGSKNKPAVGITPAQPIFAQNTLSARSYWERFIRSPLNMILMNATPNYYYPNASNEELFDLENKVQEVTSGPGLSWLELENVITKMRTMHREHTPKIEKSKNKASNTSLNISLLPGLNPRNVIKEMLLTVQNQLHETQFEDEPFDSHNISQPLASNSRPAEIQEPRNKVKDHSIAHSVISNIQVPNEVPNNTIVKNKVKDHSIVHSVISNIQVPNEVPNNEIVKSPIVRTRPTDITLVTTGRKQSDLISYMPSIRNNIYNVKSIKYKDDSDQIHQKSFQNYNDRPLIFGVRGNDFMKSKKYFIDNNANENYYSENW